MSAADWEADLDAEHTDRWAGRLEQGKDVTAKGLPGQLSGRQPPRGQPDISPRSRLAPGGVVPRDLGDAKRCRQGLEGWSRPLEGGATIPGDSAGHEVADRGGCPGYGDMKGAESGL